MADSAQILTAVIATVVSGTVAFTVTAFAHIKSREREKRERRIALIESVAIALRQRYEGLSRIAFPLHGRENNRAMLDETQDYLDLAMRLRFYGYDGCAEAVKACARAELDVYVVDDPDMSRARAGVRKVLKKVVKAEEMLKEALRETEDAGWRHWAADYFRGW
jgi:hypothetical protein